MKTYIPVIGLEIHVELKTKSGMFCQCANGLEDAAPNSQVCPVCLGLPGALPVPNKTAIEWTVKIGKALNCAISRHTKFDRKHYSYPDLAKGYQISQYDEPIARNGYLEFGKNHGTYKNEERKFRIHRVHLEEDTGKLIHIGTETRIDFNRSGVPLVEIVTEPDFSSSADVKMFLEELHAIIRYLEISDADLEKGTMRMEPNISVRVLKAEGEKPEDNKNGLGFELPKYKVEVKNINSFNFVKRAIDFEVARHIELLEKGEIPPQETRGWDSEKGITYSQRVKEDAHDYRYFPEPDIPPFTLEDSYIEAIVKTAPELPKAKMDRFIKEYKLKELDSYIITRDKKLSTYFETVLIAIKKENKENSIEQKVVGAIVNKRVSTELKPEEFAKKFLELIRPVETDSELLDSSVKTVLEGNQKAVTEYESGKQTVIMFLVGQVMKQMKGKADASTVRKALEEKLKA
jgi:aspartyl-tRNA(Asn)/glutamyl-tRNA(Gln) amidotransferase subunit B